MRLAMAMCLLLTLSAQAQSAGVKKFLTAAIALYESLEYEKALTQLQKARAKAKGPDDESSIAILEGIVLADMGKEERAVAAFKVAFGMDLEAKLPVEVSPKVAAVAERARAMVRRILAPHLEIAKAEEARRLAEEEARSASVQAQGKGPVGEARPAAQAAEVVVAPPPKGLSLRAAAWIPAGLGVASVGVGAYFLVNAGNLLASLDKGTANPDDAASIRDTGKLHANLGYVLTGVGAAALAGAVTMYALGAESPKVSLIPVRDGVLLSLSFDTH